MKRKNLNDHELVTMYDLESDFWNSQQAPLTQEQKNNIAEGAAAAAASHAGPIQYAVAIGYSIYVFFKNLTS